MHSPRHPYSHVSPHSCLVLFMIQVTHTTSKCIIQSNQAGGIYIMFRHNIKPHHLHSWHTLPPTDQSTTQSREQRQLKAKRSTFATNMSSNSAPPSTDSDTQDDFNHPNPNHVANNRFIHHIKPTFLGPICTSCNSKVASGKILFSISRISIKNHLTLNKCYSGDIAMFNGRELEKTLHTSRVHYHNSMRDNPSIASRVADSQFNFTPILC